MKMRAFALVLTVTLGTPITGAAERPNGVFILTDDLGWTDLGCYGSEYYEAPHIDGQRDHGIRITVSFEGP